MTQQSIDTLKVIREEIKAVSINHVLNHLSEDAVHGLINDGLVYYDDTIPRLTEEAVIIIASDDIPMTLDSPSNILGMASKPQTAPEPTVTNSPTKPQLHIVKKL